MPWVRAKITPWGCLRSVTHDFLNLVFSFSDRKHIPLIEHWSVIEVKRWERFWTSGVRRGRQQHLHTAETDDWRSIISFWSYFKQVCPCQPKDAERESGTRQLACQVSHSFKFSCAPLIRGVEKQWPAESKQGMQSQFTLSDITVILHRGHAAVTDVLYSGWWSEHHSLSGSAWFS